jgi:SulP family sulfate permease
MSPLPGLLAQDPTSLTGQGRVVLKDTIAGLVTSVVLVANIVSFGALMFPGELSAGTPLVVWAMLVGACISGLWIAWNTSLVPLATGIDSPTGTVLVLLSATVAPAVIGAGGNTQAAIQAVMLVFSAATLLSGALLYGLGAWRLGTYFRFVPSFVVSGFLAATGWFLAVGGLRMVLGRNVVAAIQGVGLTAMDAAKFTSAVAVLALLLGLRRWVASPLAMPAALISCWLAGSAALASAGLTDTAYGWYLPSLGALSRWSPFEVVLTSRLSWAMVPALLPELLAVTIVTLISLIAKVSSLEMARKTPGDLDREFRAHGVAHLMAAPLGGITCSLQTGSSRLLEHAGGSSRLCGAASALVLGAVALSGFDLPGLIPIPIAAGLVFYLGYTFFVDALSRPAAQRAWLEMLLALAIMAMCVKYGYLVGVLGGVVGACLLFASSCARIGAVRQHLTRAQFQSYVSRPAAAARHLTDHGEAIQLYWLAGYLFFGSSEGVFERVRRDIAARPPSGVSHVILDFGAVTGIDPSAIVSLTKLRNVCARLGVTLLYSGMPAAVQAKLGRGGLFAGKGQQPPCADLNLALAWCEDQLLGAAELRGGDDLAGFEPWLAGQMGGRAHGADLIAYLERRAVDDSQVLYRAGDAGDNIDLIAAGSLVVDIANEATGQLLRVRRITTHTVVGEMAFVRSSVRTATVSSDGPAVFYTLTRASFERMRRDRPDLAHAFDDFLLRTMADRVNMADKLVVALS